MSVNFKILFYTYSLYDLLIITPRYLLQFTNFHGGIIIN